MKIGIIIALILFLCPLALATDAMKIAENDRDMQITLELPNIDPFKLDPEVFLCSASCELQEIKSISYDDKEMDLFITPKKPGNYTLKLFVTLNGERVSYEKSVEVNNGHEKTEKKLPDITGSIVRNTMGPLSGLGLFGLLILFVFLHFKNRILKNHPLKGRIEIIMIFLLAFFIFSSVTHEFSHIIVAALFNCPATLESFIPIFTPTTVALKCEITTLQSILILSAGIVGNIMLGFFLYFLSLKRNNFTLCIVSQAYFFSSFIYFFYTTGDIHSIMNVLNLFIPQTYMNLIGLSLILVLILVFYRNNKYMKK